MILRRFMQHVREQNWFAVGLDVLVVIVGIFLGLQVQTAYEERNERSLEQVYLERIHMEVLEGLDYQTLTAESFNFSDWIIRTQQDIDQLAKALDGMGDLNALGTRHCMAIMATHIYVNPTITLPTVTELISSGQLSIIQNERVKNILSQLILRSETIKAIIAHYDSVNLVISQKYPDLIKLNREMVRTDINPIENPGVSCDFHAMAQNQAFKNDFFDNAAKQAAYLPALINFRDKLSEFHLALDAELGITH